MKLMVDKTSRAVVLKPDKTSSLLVCSVLCFACMLISNVHKSIIVMNSLDTRFNFLRMFLKSFKKLAAHVLLGLKPLGLASWF